MERLANQTPINLEQENQERMTVKEKVGVGLGSFVLLSSAAYYGSTFAETTYDIAKSIVENI